MKIAIKASVHSGSHDAPSAQTRSHLFWTSPCFLLANPAIHHYIYYIMIDSKCHLIGLLYRPLDTKIRRVYEDLMALSPLWA